MNRQHCQVRRLQQHINLATTQRAPDTGRWCSDKPSRPLDGFGAFHQQIDVTAARAFIYALAEQNHPCGAARMFANCQLNDLLLLEGRTHHSSVGAERATSRAS